MIDMANWYDKPNKFYIDRDEALQKEAYKVYGSIEVAKTEINKYLKYVREHPVNSYESGGTIYTDNAHKALEKAIDEIGKYVVYQKECTAKGKAYAEEVKNRAKQNENEGGRKMLKA